MALDPRIAQAIREAVSEEGQPAELANKMIAWIGDLATGNAKIQNRDDVKRRIQLLYDTVSITDGTVAEKWL